GVLLHALLHADEPRVRRVLGHDGDRVVAVACPFGSAGGRLTAGSAGGEAQSQDGGEAQSRAGKASLLHDVLLGVTRMYRRGAWEGWIRPRRCVISRFEALQYLKRFKATLRWSPVQDWRLGDIASHESDGA